MPFTSASSKAMHAARRRPVEDRFMAFVMPEPNSGCWLWMGCLNTHGYAKFQVSGHGIAGSRWAYQHFVGLIPEGLQIDHKCRVRCCVNPDHLRPLTQKENILCGIGAAALNAQKTHCVNGHEFNKANTYLHVRLGTLRRCCRICQSENKRLRRKHRKMDLASPAEGQKHGN